MSTGDFMEYLTQTRQLLDSAAVSLRALYEDVSSPGTKSGLNEHAQILTELKEIFDDYAKGFPRREFSTEERAQAAHRLAEFDILRRDAGRRSGSVHRHPGLPDRDGEVQSGYDPEDPMASLDAQQRSGFEGDGSFRNRQSD